MAASEQEAEAAGGGDPGRQAGRAPRHAPRGAEGGPAAPPGETREEARKRALAAGVRPPGPAEAGRMAYLGAVVPAGMAKHARKKGLAAIPQVVLAADGGVLGVAAAAAPGLLGAPLYGLLEAAGHAGGPFRAAAPGQLTEAQRVAAARAIQAAADPALNKEAAMSAFGIRPADLRAKPAAPAGRRPGAES